MTLLRWARRYGSRWIGCSVVVLVASGCGRLGFDPDDAGGARDASGTDASGTDASGTDGSMADAALPGRCESPVVDVRVDWNTFLGGSVADYGHGADRDGVGGGYFCGMSIGGWGAPVHAHGEGGWDGVVGRVDRDGNLLWHTFLGDVDAADDQFLDLVADDSGRVYAVGHSNRVWGSPIRPFSAGYDGLVVVLAPDGGLVWMTFLGGSGDDVADGVALGPDGSVYAVGRSSTSWGAPIAPFAGGTDAFVVRLDPGGGLLSHTFLGGPGDDHAADVAVDEDGGARVVGVSAAPWGVPVHAFAGGEADAYLAKLGPDGSLGWNTFMGSAAGRDEARRVAIGEGGDLLVTGYASGAWSTPIRPFSGGIDGFVARIAVDGTLRWTTFLGAPGDDVIDGVVIAGGGTIYLSGFSRTTWGAPIVPYAGGPSDAFVVRLDADGTLVWSTFVGGTGGSDPVDDDYGNALAQLSDGSLLLLGDTDSSWGSPRIPYTAEHDLFAAKLVDATTCGGSAP